LHQPMNKPVASGFDHSAKISSIIFVSNGGLT